MRREIVNVIIPAEVAAGTPTEMERFGYNARVEVDTGAWAATIQIQERVGSGAWRTIGANFSGGTGGMRDIPDSATQVRANVTAYTSGSPTGRVAGIDTTKN